MWPNVIDCIESALNIRSKLSYLNTVINVYSLKLEFENEINFVKRKIKDTMLQSSRRLEGLLLLYTVVHSDPILYVDNWSQVVLGSLKCSESAIPREIPLKVLNKMLINFANNCDHAPVFTLVVPEFLSFILDSKDEKFCKLSYQSLAACMKYAPEMVRDRLDDIEKLLVKELGNPYGEIIEAVGECFAVLPLCTSRSKNGSDYKDVWCQLFTKIMNTIHFLLNSLLTLPEDQEEYLDVSKLSVLDLSSTELDVCNPMSLIDIFKSLCQCMAKMMSSGSHLVHIPVSELLKTLNRIFRVEKIVKHHNQNEQVGYFLLGFPQMINGAYIVLEALILNLNIFEQSYNFVILITMSLKSMVGSFSQPSVSQVRSATWKLLNIWLKQYGSKGSYQVATDRTILQEILLDISIDEKQLQTSDLKEKENAYKILTCTYALKVLKSLFETSCCYMEKDSIDKICIKLLRISKIVLKHMSPKKTFPSPYSDEKCRKMLFDVLHTCALFSDPLHSKCILEAQNIFNAASRDTSAKVRRICYTFRKLSRYYLNPRKPPPIATQYSNSGMLNIQQNVIEHARSAWEFENEFSNANGPSSDDQMDDSDVAHVQDESAYDSDVAHVQDESAYDSDVAHVQDESAYDSDVAHVQDESAYDSDVAHVQDESAYSDRIESETDLIPIEQESAIHMNHDYRVNSKQSSQTLGEEESIDDSDIEPTYIATDSNPQRIGLNDSSHINSFGMQSCEEQYANGTRTERHTSEGIVPNFANNVENNIEHIFVEVKSALKPSQVPVENGDWKKENDSESEEDESDMDEEGDEEGEANEEVSGCDEASNGKHSPEFDEERPSKRQKCIDEEEDDNEDIEDEDIPINNQSSSEEENESNTVIALEASPGSDSENQLDEDDDTESGSPSFREMCDDFVLAEPAASEIS